MTANLHLAVDNTRSDAAMSAMTVHEREALLHTLRHSPGSVTYEQFRSAVTRLGDSISFETYDELFHAHIKHSPSAETLENRALLAILGDSDESEVLLGKIERIKAIGLTGV